MSDRERAGVQGAHNERAENERASHERAENERAENERALSVRIEGLVQGVGYRAFTQDQAEALGITGWVVNRNDGSVEAALHGAGPALAELIGQLRRGPSGARVDKLDIRSTDKATTRNVPAGGYAF